MNIEIELYEEDGAKWVYLSHDGSSGCKYKYNNADELAEIVSSYVKDAVLEQEEN